ncbi:unnamed protein product, partial [Mesorhabditis spiculigera]
MAVALLCLLALAAVCAAKQQDFEAIDTRKPWLANSYTTNPSCHAPPVFVLASSELSELDIDQETARRAQVYLYWSSCECALMCRPRGVRTCYTEEFSRDEVLALLGHKSSRRALIKADGVPNFPVPNGRQRASVHLGCKCGNSCSVWGMKFTPRADGSTDLIQKYTGPML